MLKRILAALLALTLLCGLGLPTFAAWDNGPALAAGASEPARALHEAVRAPEDCFVLPFLDMENLTVAKGDTAFFEFLIYTDDPSYSVRLEIYRGDVSTSSFVTGNTFELTTGSYRKSFRWDTSGASVGTYTICSMLLDSDEEIVSNSLMSFELQVVSKAIALKSLSFRESETVTPLTNWTMFVGDTLNVQLKYDPDNASVKRAERDVLSSNTTVAEVVDFAGLIAIHGMAPGTSTISTTVGGKTAKLRVVVLQDRNCPSAKFMDVPDESNWAHKGIDYAVSHGLFAGTSDNTFSPDDSMTRAMMVTVLWRFAGKPTASGTNPFRDVPTNAYYYEPVLWAAANGVVSGVSADRFDPNGKITREQIAAIMYRYTDGQGYDTSEQADLSVFPDANKVSGYAVTPIAWANKAGLINGDSVNGVSYIKPKDNATRAQVAAILMRYATSSFQPKAEPEDKLSILAGTWTGNITYSRDDDSLLGKKMTLVLDKAGKGTLTMTVSANAVVQYSKDNNLGNPVYTLTLVDKNGNTTGGGILTYNINPDSPSYGALMLTATDMNVIFQKTK